MINKIFFFFLKHVKTPTFFFNLNLWLFLNIQIFTKILTNYLVYFIEGLSGLKLNLIFIQWKDFSFWNFYLFYCYFFIFITFFFFLI